MSGKKHKQKRQESKKSGVVRWPSTRALPDDPGVAYLLPIPLDLAKRLQALAAGIQKQGFPLNHNELGAVLLAQIIKEAEVSGLEKAFRDPTSQGSSLLN